MKKKVTIEFIQDGYSAEFDQAVKDHLAGEHYKLLIDSLYDDVFRPFRYESLIEGSAEYKNGFTTAMEKAWELCWAHFNEGESK